jgi:NosR/NirI family nitrous oxide reductase transcriptional regulator
MLSPMRGWFIHGLRLSLFAAIVWLIHDQHRWHMAQQAGRQATAITLPDVKSFFPSAAKLGDWSPARGEQLVLDASDQSLGYVVQTSPTSDNIVGYSGPTNVLLAFDNDHRLFGATVLSSRDTVEHVEDVRRDSRFWNGFRGRTWDELQRGVDIDAVSGATLTSLATVEGVAARLGGAKPALRFPEPVSVAEVLAFFPGAERIESQSGQFLVDVLAADDRRLGSILRTSPSADDRIGYQGPTDTLIAVGLDQRIVGTALRNSFDNDPYIRYVREDESFRSLFNGKVLAEVAQEKAKVEGVSGATMTSQAVADGISKAARAAITPTSRSPRMVFGTRDAGTLSVLAVALVICFTRLRGHRWARIIFQLVLIGYFGFANGDLLSQAQLVGWAQSGVPWRLAPGLALLTAAAMLVPVLSKKQLYCHHICPFGAIQQLVKLRLPWQVRLGRSLNRWLAVVPVALLALVVCVALWHWPMNLASIEPFDAFVFWIAGGATIVVAIAGLVASLIVPMAYCRFGCPTGAMLTHLRRNAHSGNLSWRDYVVVLLLVVALVGRYS